MVVAYGCSLWAPVGTWPYLCRYKGLKLRTENRTVLIFLGLFTYPNNPTLLILVWFTFCLFFLLSLSGEWVSQCQVNEWAAVRWMSEQMSGEWVSHCQVNEWATFRWISVCFKTQLLIVFACDWLTVTLATSWLAGVCSCTVINESTSWTSKPSTSWGWLLDLGPADNLTPSHQLSQKLCHSLEEIKPSLTL